MSQYRNSLKKRLNRARGKGKFGEGYVTSHVEEHGIDDRDWNVAAVFEKDGEDKAVLATNDYKLATEAVKKL